MLTIPIYSRVFNVVDFGQAGIYLFFIQIFSTVAALRYDLALLNTKTNVLAAQLIKLAFILIFSICSSILVISTIVYFLYPDPTVATSNLFLIPAGIFLISLFTLFNYWFTRENSFSLMAGARIFQTVIGAGAPLVMYPMGYGVAALVIGAFLARSAGLFVYLAAFGRMRRLSAHLARGGHVSLGGVVRKYGSFPLYSAPQVFVNTAAMAIAPVIVTVLGDQELGGQMWTADRIMLSGIAVFGVSFGQVLLGQLRGKNAAYQMKAAVLENHISLLKFGPIVVVSIGCFLFAFAPLVLGSEWDRVGPIALLLTFPAIAQLLSSPLSVVVGLLDKNKENLVFHCIALLLRAAPFAILCIVNIDMAIPVYAVITFGVYFVYLVYLLKLVGIEKIEYFQVTGKYWKRFFAYSVPCISVVLVAVHVWGG